MFIVIEGVDGVGKSTQLELLLNRLKKDLKKEVAVFDFPQYSNNLGGKLVAKFLRGEFGGINEVNPYLASLPYAIDRWHAKEKIEKALEKGKLVLANRYTLSSRAHQTAKVSPKKRAAFLKFLEELEYKMFKIPRENFTILLYLQAKNAQEMIDKKSQRKYLKKEKRDIHENDLKHLEEANKMYVKLAKKNPRQILLINCSNKDGSIKTPNEIHDLVWNRILTYLK